MRLIHLDNVRLRELIEPAGLVESIRDGFNGSLESLPRLHQTIPGAHPSTLLLMPAWQRGGDIGIKMVTVDARRSRQGGEAVNGVYVLLDGASGSVSALLDAHVLTASRTAATLLRDATVARRDAEEITVFKAVGSAIADLAVAQFFLRRHHETPTMGTGAIR
jgi:ornithine cyclodeaminase/alanine dehydrogenase-like protein (mu-crystallin family)